MILLRVIFFKYYFRKTQLVNMFRSISSKLNQRLSKHLENVHLMVNRVCFA